VNAEEVIMQLEIFISADQKKVLMVKKGDDPKQTVEKFAKKYNLPEEKHERL